MVEKSKEIRFQKYLHCIALSLLFPALLINLDLIAFINDEGIRSLVTLEMMMSGDYIAPSLFGERYYNKPPFYNWILLFFFKLTGKINELTARIPTLFFLALYAWTVFYFFKKYFSVKIAFLNAFLLITCGRILFWDSMLGLIDICFSWVIFSMFMIVYHKFQKKQFYQLFGWAYLFTAIAFLLKGLPAIVFLGTTLLAQFISQKQLNKFFSLYHLFGGFIFFFVIGGYYFLYSQNNSLETILGVLFSESFKRTFIEHGWVDTISHFFTFPFEMIYHFLPWSVFVIFFFRKSTYQIILKNDFIRYNILIFLATIFVYWISVEVYPRYLLMHVPLIFSTYLYVYFENKKRQTLLYRFLKRLFFISCLLAILTTLSLVFFRESLMVAYFYFKVASIFIVLTILTYLYKKLKNQEIIIIVLVLLVIRIGFNWFVLPSRLDVEWSTQMKKSSIEIGRKFQPLYGYKSSVGWQPANAFYLTRETDNILKSHYENFDTCAYYLIHDRFKCEVDFEELGTMRMSNKELYYIGKIIID